MTKHLVPAIVLAATAFVAWPAFAQQPFQASLDRYALIGDDYRSDDYHNDDRSAVYRDGRLEFASNSGGYGDNVRCESRNDARHYCAINLRNYDVSVIRQLSDGRCEEGRSWGHDRRGIWVDHGCRAEFGIDVAQSQGYADRYRGEGLQRCESRDNRRVYCRTTGSRSVQLVSQISNNSCIAGRSWGFNRSSIWVDSGCRGDFRLIQ